MFCTNCGKPTDNSAKFCPFCGKEISIGSGTNSQQSSPKDSGKQYSAPKSAPNSSSFDANQIQSALQTLLRKPNISWDFENDFTDDNAVLDQILSKNQSYYIQAFQDIKSNKKERCNWWSLLLGGIHAAYRNMWREWLDYCKYPLGLGAISMLVMVVAAATFSLILIGVASLASTVASIWLLIADINFGRHFNLMYMHRVDDMLSGKSPVVQDANQKNAMYATIITVVVPFIINLITSI